MNVHALLARFLKLFEHLLRFIEAVGVALQFHPALACGHFHAQGVLEVFQEFNVVRVERLQSAWALKLQGASFGHNRGIGLEPMVHRHDADATNVTLPEAIHQRPVRAFLW